MPDTRPKFEVIIKIEGQQDFNWGGKLSNVNKDLFDAVKIYIKEFYNDL